MSARLTTLLEKRASVWEQMKEIRDRADATTGLLSEEDEATYTRAESDLDKYGAEIDREERAVATEKVDRSRIIAPRDGDGDDTEDRSAEDDKDEPDLRYREAFQEYVVRGLSDMESELKVVLRKGWNPDKENRAAGVGSGSAGGYLVPQGFRAQIIETMKAYGAVHQVAQVLNTSTGNPLPWPTNDDTGNVGALLAENAQSAEQDITLGTAQLGAYKYTSKIIRVSLEFLQDVDWMDSEAFLRRKFAERLGRIHNQHFTTGTGSSQPQGIVTGATSGVTAAGTAAITADELLDLVHSVDPAYRNSNAQFMFKDSTLKLVRKLKDSQNRYLWEPSVQAGTAPNLFGYGYVVNQDMATAATGVKSVLFGDFHTGYVIRLVKAFELIRMNERYADYGQVGFVAFDRADGLVQDANAYKALTQA